MNPLHDLTSQPATDPTSIYRYRDGLYAVDLLTAAIVEFDLFTWLADNPSDLAAICKHFGIVERPTDVMLTLFTAMGLLRREGDIFHLTDLGREHLVNSSPWFIGPYYASLKERPVCIDMIRALRTGKPANWASDTKEKEWAKAMEGEDFANRFTAAMDCRGIYLSQAAAKSVDLSRHRHLLDIAGGSGIYACSFVAHHPALRATVLEKPPVDQIAAKAIAKRGFSDRVSVIARDMVKDSFPDDCDVHLVSNVLHDWDVPLVEALLAKSAEALPRGGLIIVHDAYINAEKTGPLPVAAYSALLMNLTEGKCYSVAEMQGFLAAAGFGEFSFKPTAADRSVLSATKL
jgi:predicted O-methyltransferase YrrM